ncbi:CAP domain-containing protein [Streptomyces sp. NPDC003011]
MGRHRRSAAGRAATGRATGVTPTGGSSMGSHDPQDSYSFDHGVPGSYGHGPQGPYADGLPTDGIAPYLNSEEYAETSARSAAYLFASEADYATVFGPDTGSFRGDGFTPGEGRRGGSRRRRRRAATPVKTGLLGVSAAVALGTVAVATGAVPGLDNYRIGGGDSSGGGNVQAAGTPTNSPAEQGGTSGSAENRDGSTSTSRDAERSASPTPTPSPSTPTSSAPTKAPTKKPKATPSEKPRTTPSRAATKAPQETSAPVTVSAETQAAAEVLRLVNEERAKAGCDAVSANSALSGLAEDFSDAMAAQGFFDHTDPSGATPWDRATKAGITDLGGENIARGQADAAAVMAAWMDSPGHKANILNCDFKTLGVGVHFGSGGPWWTQDFGY